ncbi:MAG: polyprenyl synthetase family protein [Dehalococcoidia bacterium]
MNTKRGLPDSCTSYHRAVRVELESVIDSSPPVLGNMLRYHMGLQDQNDCACEGGSGKLIRPGICLLSCRAAGGDTSQALPAAAAVELIHNFSLIHDDIEDASEERHHRPAVWTLWGTPQAINAGDAMFALAYLALLRLSERGLAYDKIARSAQMLSHACLELCEGQYHDIAFENRLDITIEDYLGMAGKKTAALLAASTSLGAYLGSGDELMVDSFYLFGRELGMAFQIRDDIIGIWGTEDNIGKPATDIPKKKKTLPVVYGLQHGADIHRERLQQLYTQGLIGNSDTDEVKTILEASGARDYAESMAEQYHYRALAALGACGLDLSGMAPLEELARFLLRRDF